MSVGVFRYLTTSSSICVEPKRSFEVKHVPIKDEVTIVVTNSNVKHELVNS